MSGGFDAIANIGLSEVLDFAPDIGSVTDLVGTEFLSSFDITSFEIPSFDIPSLGGFDVAGSFAGSAEWFNTFNPGSILDSIPSVSDFSLPSLTSSIPSLSSLNVNSFVTSAASSFGISPSLTASATKLLNNPALISTAAASLGINPAIVSSATRVLNGASPISTIASSFGINPSLVSSATNILKGGSPVTEAASAFGINPTTATSLTAKATSLFTTDPNSSNTIDVATGLPINTPREVDEFGLSILTDSEAAALTRNVTPGFISSLTDPAVNSQNAVDAATGLPINTPRPVSNEGAASQFTSAYDPETGQWSVFNNTTGVTTQSNLTEQEAIIAAENLNITDGVTFNTDEALAEDPFEAARLSAEARLDSSPTETDVQSFIDQARNQQTIRDLRQNKADSSDWRVRLRLAPNSTYLYNDPSPGILAPLASKNGTDGVIFPYTPNIETAYKANYDPYDLTHSNYRGYFYKNSYVDVINMRATFTAQDTEEANYLLAVIHFFRSATKMFYGKDAQRGSPPPLVYLSGYGDFQFNEHPCVIQQFNYTLPADVDYIRAQSALDVSTSMLGNRIRQSTPGNPLSYAVNRLLNNSLTKGALDNRPPIVSNLAVGNPTYVPTKIEISVSLFPMQSRQQVSKQFSLQAFANGNQLKGGFW